MAEDLCDSGRAPGEGYSHSRESIEKIYKIGRQFDEAFRILKDLGADVDDRQDADKRDRYVR